MLNEKISTFFDFLPEKNLTEEYFYEHKGNYPVYSGQTRNEGIVSYIDNYEHDGNCVTVTTYGNNAGRLFFRIGKYTIGRNCMGIKPKKQYLDQINMEWFSYKFQNLFYKLRIGDLHGQRSLNQKLIKNVIINIPSIEIQVDQLYQYRKLQKMIKHVTKIQHEISEFLENKLDYFPIKFTNHLSEIFNICGGNNNLTEEFIYNNQPTTSDEAIPIYSGSTIQSTSLGFIERTAQKKSKGLKISKAPAIIVVRKGLAGTMKYVKTGDFTITDDAYVMTLKTEWKNKINLRWFVLQYQDLFKNLVTSKSDNATFSKEYAEQQTIAIPPINAQNNIAKKIIKLDALKIRLIEIEKNAYDLVKCQIIY